MPLLGYTAVAGVATVIAWFYGKQIVSLSLFAIIGGLAAFLSWLVGMIQGVFTAILFQIAPYNDFINEEVVKTGWVVIRDVSNMFFILVMLIIAFATILRIESYSWKKNLPKLLIMAVLINFSKTICGLVIDFSQVIMLTFVNAFGNSGPGNLYNAFGIQKLYTLQGVGNAAITGEETAKAINNNYSFAITGSLVLGLIMLIIACIVIACFVIILLFRIIMLWILIILSPLAFLAMAIPAGAKYASQWTSEFSKYIVIGPVMAFFLWLALSMSTAGRVPIDYKFNAYEKGGIVELGTGSEISQPANMKNFLVTTLFLLAGLMMAQQVGGAVGNVAGKGMAWAKKAPLALGAGGLMAGGWVGRKIYASKGLELRPTKIIQGIKESLKSRAEDEEKMGASKAGAALKEGKLWGGLGASRDFTEAAARGFLWRRGWWGKDSVIAQTYQKGRAKKQMQDIERQLEKEKDPIKIKELTEKFQAKKTEWASYKAPETFYAEEKRNAMVREKMKSFFDNDNAEDLHNILMSAIDSNQSSLALAAALQMAKVGHINEMLNKTKAIDDYYDENNELRIRKDDYLPVGVYGMRAFAQQYLMGKNSQDKGLKLSEQEAYSVIAQLSTQAKGVRHHVLAELIGSENGSKFIRTAKEQRPIASGEYRKNDAEQNIRTGNRLANMDEIQFETKKGDPSSVERVAVVTELTERNFVNQLSAWEREISTQKRFNANFAENLFKNFLYVNKHPEVFTHPDQRKTLLDVAEEVNIVFKDSKGNATSTQLVALQTLEKGSEIYEGLQKGQKAEDTYKVNKGLMTKKDFDDKWSIKDSEFAEMKQMIADGIAEETAKLPKSAKS